MRVIISNLLIRPEPYDFLEPNDDMSVDVATKTLRPFMPFKEKHTDGRWYESMTGYADKKYIVTGVNKEADNMMEYTIIE